MEVAHICGIERAQWGMFEEVQEGVRYDIGHRWEGREWLEDVVLRDHVFQRLWFVSEFAQEIDAFFLQSFRLSIQRRRVHGRLGRSVVSVRAC